jgi:mercuric ion transport protein
MTVSNTNSKNKLAAPPTGWFAGLGVVAGLGAIAASSCCVLPLALAGIGVTGAALGVLAILVYLRPFLLGAAVLALVAGWVQFLRRRAASCDTDECCAAPASSNRMAMVLSVGTALVTAGVIWKPYVEPLLIEFVR